VPASPPSLDVTTRCEPLLDGEELAAVSPEGHAWLLRSGESTELRVLDPLGEMTSATHELAFSAIEQVLAWSDTEATLVADGGLFELVELDRISIVPPAGFDGSAAFCGRPSESGFVLAGGALSELRTDGLWWSWGPALEGGAVIERIAKLDGECQARDSRMWLSSSDDAVLELTATELRRHAEIEGLVDVAATDAHVFALDATSLHVGPGTWQEWVFEGAAPESLQAAGGFVFMRTGEGRLLRFDGESFAAIEPEGSLERFLPHATGLWSTGGGEVCHHAFGSLVRLHGVRPHQRVKSEFVSVGVETDAGAAPTLELDGEPVALTDDEGLLGAELELSVGWHELVARAGETTRTTWIKRLPATERSFAADIAPLYTKSCASSGCHGDGSADLSTADAWRERADEIRKRVVEARTMPPPANVPAGWGEDDVQIVAEWLEGGML
jgi:mono/diheme cytochrome c family protein